MVINERAKDNLGIGFNPMGYIQDLEQELNEMLSDLPEERQKKIIRFIKVKVLESYKNGIMSAKLVKAEKEAERKARKYKSY